eukprot:TRINITY_DN25998_c0_g1_i1.p2 TRINITY_DN25998_c0_g1~~TRINITY_DN25998_c0_g1_i1.p2  ORF type:complete len:154 (+),score=64.43 TRINITY_DN25998_c0_g1_i1:42-503(+)
MPKPQHDDDSGEEELFGPRPSTRVKISNCVDDFNDTALKKMLGKPLAVRIVPDGITWAVNRVGLTFAGFGWVEFETEEHARRMTEFDVMGTRAKEGRSANDGNDLFIAYHSEEIPDGRCGFCGKDGHFARECLKRLNASYSDERPAQAKRARH